MVQSTSEGSLGRVGESKGNGEALYRRLFGGLLHNVGHGVGDRSLEHDTLGLETGEVDKHEMSG
jgi:hypothetical protein